MYVLCGPGLPDHKQVFASPMRELSVYLACLCGLLLCRAQGVPTKAPIDDTYDLIHPRPTLVDQAAPLFSRLAERRRKAQETIVLGMVKGFTESWVTGTNRGSSYRGPDGMPFTEGYRISINSIPQGYDQDEILDPLAEILKRNGFKLKRGTQNEPSAVFIVPSSDSSLSAP